MKKCNTCLIFGGKSKEYEVSLRSAYFALKSIDPSLFDVCVIGITREGKWYFYKGEYEHILNDCWEKGELCPVQIDFSRGCLLMEQIPYKPDIIFPIMHGENYEDGRIQGLFDMLGLKYVGCDFFSSVLCFNKHLTKQIARGLQIPVAKDALVTRRDLDSFFDVVCRAHYDLSLPVFVKPSGAGSSFGVRRVRNIGNLYQATKGALEHSPYALIEEQIDGEECEIGVLEANGSLMLSPVGKIKHQGDFYDYNTKYHSSTVEYEIPAKIDPVARNKIQLYARELFCALGCKGLARFDFFVKGDKVVFNEVNTMPGLTDSSMYPMLFEKGGVFAPELIKAICQAEPEV